MDFRVYLTPRGHLQHKADEVVEHIIHRTVLDELTGVEVNQIGRAHV